MFGAVRIRRSAFLPVLGQKAEFPVFVEFSNDLVISVAGGGRKFRGTNFNLAPM